MPTQHGRTADAGGAAIASEPRGVTPDRGDPLHDLQQTFGNQAVVRLMAPLSVQRMPREESVLGDGDLSRGPEPAAHAADPVDAPRSFVVEDDETNVDRTHQMRRTEFLARVRKAVCATANEGFAATGRTANDCPWIDHWLGYYEQRDAAHLNRSLRKAAPETARAATAEDAVALIATRVRRSVDHYARTGELTGIPDGFSPEIPGLGLLGGLFGGLLFKARPEGVRQSDQTPAAVRAQLGSGRPLPSDVRSRMGAMFGCSFSDVRVHTDASAARLSHQVNARAFSVGEHVAFGAGEYRPGTLVGDALIAHELAHTIQQSNAAANHRSASTVSLETDADRSALAAVTTLWSNRMGLRTPAGRAAPRSRSGLRLSRCSPKAPGPSAKTTPVDQAKQQALPPERPPAPESSYWFEDPKKQQKLEGDQTIDFGQKGKGGEKPDITTSAQTKQQVVVDKPSQYSKVGDVWVRFAYSLSDFSGGKESTRLKSAKKAVLDALGAAIKDIGGFDIGDVSWENKEEEKRVRAKKKQMEEDRARMLELLRGYTRDKPLNVYLAPETEEEFRTGNYIPTTAQVWVSMDDVGDAAKLKTAMRLPLHHILGGSNPAKGGGVDPAADLKRTLVHESVHAMLLNRSADSGKVWKAVQGRMKLTGSDALQKRALDVIRAYILAQEELFAYRLEETLYAPVTSGSMQSGKVLYEQFMKMVELFFTKKKVAFDQSTFKIEVEEKVGKKKVPWEISYKSPKALDLVDADKSVLDLAIKIWPLK